MQLVIQVERNRVAQVFTVLLVNRLFQVEKSFERTKFIEMAHASVRKALYVRHTGRHCLQAVNYRGNIAQYIRPLNFAQRGKDTRERPLQLF